MASARTHTATLIGVDAHVVEVEATVSNGLPGTTLTGLPESSHREARDRVRAAIMNSGEPWPATKVNIELSPASLPKHGSASDLAIAVSVLAADGAVPALDRPVLFHAELGLDGRVRPVRGVLPAVLASASNDITTAVVAEANAAEASQAPNVHVVPAASLRDVVAWLRGGPEPPRRASTAGNDPQPEVCQGDLADIPGRDEARRAAEICAAGGRNLSLCGPPGSGAAMLAERIPTILPDLDPQAALEVTSLHSLAGMLPESGVITRPPFIAPHHTISLPAMIGGGGGPGIIGPGAASLAHRGILFLEHAPEFPRNVIDALRQPVATGEVIIARGDVQARLPARFCLVLAACPCPCTASGNPPGKCSCTPAMRRRYLARVSCDAIDLKVSLALPSAGRPATGEPSAVVRDRVLAARERAAARLADTPWRLNADVPPAELRRLFPVAPGADAALDHAVDVGMASRRSALRAIGVAWTIADLYGRNRPSAEDCALALTLMLGRSGA